MDGMGRLITRGFLSLLHISSGIVSGTCVVYTLIRWGTMEKCLPPMVQLSGGTLILKNHLPDLCDSIYTILTVVAFLHLAMCAFVNFLWKYKSNSFLLVSLVLSLSIAAFCVFIASFMTTYKMVWCDIIKQRVSKEEDDTDCELAANKYCKMVDSRNMTRYYDRIEVQVLGFWSLVPLAFIIVLLYGIALILPRSTRPADTQPGVLHREVTPLPPSTPPNASSDLSRPADENSPLLGSQNNDLQD